MTTKSSNPSAHGGFQHGIPQVAETPLNLAASSGCCGTTSQTSASGCCGEPAVQNTVSAGKPTAQGCCGEPITTGATAQTGGCCGEPTSNSATTQMGCCN